MAEISSFDFARLAALKQYSDLERELSMVMRYALGTDHQAAVVVYYGITNTRARYAIIGKLLGTRDNGAYRKSWECIERWLTPCDTDRNQLIHWSEGEATIIDFQLEGPTAISTHKVLRHPSGGGPKSPHHSERDIWIKRDKMRVMLQIVNRFGLTLAAPTGWPWLDIFQRPPACRNPVEFLQALNDKGHPAHLPPYERRYLGMRASEPSPD